MQAKNLTHRAHSDAVPLAVESELDVVPRAQRMLADYLRAWGLRDPQAIALHCRLWTNAYAQPAGAAKQAPGAAVLSGILEQASRDMEAWLTRLADVVADDAPAAKSNRGLLAMQLQSVIDHYPSVLLKDAELPAKMLEQLRGAARAAVPTPFPTQMRPQPLDVRMSPLRWEWWLQPLRRWRRVLPDGNFLQ